VFYAYKQCEFIKTNGVRCGSPAMRGFFYCYFHRNSLEPTAPAGMSSYKLPVLEDPETIQVAITRVIQGLAYGTIDAVRAKFMLYALQIASQNIKRSNFKPSPTSVVTDLTSEMLMNHYSQNPLSPKPVVKNHEIVAPDPLPGLGPVPNRSNGKT
jgi:hypothetical protein